MKKLYVFDIDGTLANAGHRLHHIIFNANQLKPGQVMADLNPDWDAFYAEQMNDTPIMSVIHTMNALSVDSDIMFITGRRNAVRDETINWIDPYASFAVEDCKMFMRPDGDKRHDYEVKEDIYNSLLDEDKERLVAVFEDRQQVVDMWRRLGIKCYQVVEGNY